MTKHLRYIFMAVLAASCSTGPMPETHDPNADEKDCHVKGIVLNMTEEPVEHLKVTVDWNSGMYQDIQYTDSDGMFTTAVRHAGADDAVTMNITIEDIDGEEYGGAYETLVENITLFEAGETCVNVTLDFRLNLASASESNPQS